MDPTEEPSGDDDALLESDRYQPMHDLFRYAREHGFDEEPPARIDAILMAAARQHAPEKTGALARFRKWMVATLMQPAVAGAVAVAVIGGSAGILYLKGRGNVAEPTVASDKHAGAPPAAPTPAPERKDVTIDLPSAGTESVTSSSTHGADLGRLRELDEKQRESGQADTERGDKPKGATGPGGGGGGGTRGGGADGNVKDPFGGEGDTTFDYKPDGRDSTKTITTETGGSSTGGRTDGMVGGVKTQITVPDDRSPRPPPDGTGTSDDEDADKEQEDVTKGAVTPETTTVRTTKPPPSKRTQAENLLRQARSAAKQKNCAAVRTMAKRARQLDAAYYRDTFVRDAALKDCL